MPGGPSKPKERWSKQMRVAVVTASIALCGTLAAAIIPLVWARVPKASECTRPSSIRLPKDGKVSITVEGARVANSQPLSDTIEMSLAAGSCVVITTSELKDLVDGGWRPEAAIKVKEVVDQARAQAILYKESQNPLWREIIDKVESLLGSNISKS